MMNKRKFQKVLISSLLAGALALISISSINLFSKQEAKVDVAVTIRS